MRGMWWLRASCGLFCLLSLSAFAVPSSERPPVQYLLGKESLFQEGCFEPCMCPMLVGVPVEGSFKLVFTGLVDGFRTFRVEGIDWTVPFLGRRYTGSGVYRVERGTAPLQQLLLDLERNDGQADKFDSGLVPAGADLPAISAVISIHGMYCFDTVFTVDARPGRPAPDIKTWPSDLSWDPLAWTSAYDVVWGDLGRLRGSGGFQGATEGCLADDLTETTVPLYQSPAPGEGFWYVVRGVGGGNYDSNGIGQVSPRDPDIDSAPFHCP